MPRTESFRPPAGPAGADRGDHVESGPEASPTLSEAWSELMPDVFVLPAAVEAAQATADEGPGPWPPVVADDPVDAQDSVAARSMASRATAAVPAIPPASQPLQALKRLLGQVKARRRGVVSEYTTSRHD